MELNGQYWQLLTANLFKQPPLLRQQYEHIGGLLVVSEGSLHTVQETVKVDHTCPIP